tara:strand:+ start:1385 stop:2416 length:1032 start_codon:yes stop_codon:yes gene_type:complete
MAYTTINKSTDYFQTELWSSQDTSIDTINFAPDWVWIKSRTNADTQVLFDRVRGANKRLSSSANSAETTTSDELTAFNSDGYTLGTGSNVNRASNNYVSWNWRAAGTTGSANTDGSINSTVSVNTTAGFSIVSYTGTGANATVGHGLGAAPKMIIFKETNGTRNWRVYHNEMGNAKIMYLNTNSVESSDATAFNSTSPTSSVFSVGTSGGTNASGNGYIAYCFAEKTGYSKFGKYNGNGNANGTFVYTGFKPSFIMIKDTDNAESWMMYDNKRPGYNLNANHLMAESNTTETASTANTMDILSNGFKMRATNNAINRSGGEGFTYMAFGQSLVGTNNVPCTAR